MHRTTAVLVAGLLAAAALPAHSGPPGIASANVELLTTLPTSSGAVSMAFASDKPLLYVSTIKGIETYDVATPAAPKLLATEPMHIEQNEGMNLGERPSGEKFALVASNGRVIGAKTQITDDRHLVVVDVTDPADPEVVAQIPTPTRTHTLSCASARCDYAFSDGRSQGAMTVVDLRDWRRPKVLGTVETVVRKGHDQDLDAAGILWHGGGEGAVALDVRDPRRPVALNSTNEDGVEGRSAYNDFIIHNTTRPNARAFRQSRVKGTLTSGAPDVRRGNVLLATEEDLLNTALGQPGTTCGNDGEGSFSTWHIPFLDAKEYRKVNPDKEFGGGTIAPLDRWNTELMESGVRTPAGGFCSAHYFTYHEAGFVAQGWYEQGTRILDVRDARDIKQVGYFVAGATETWGAYWVPERKNGRVTGRMSNLVYTADHVRGIDVLRVALPQTAPADTVPVRAPILPSWLAPSTGIDFRRTEDWGLLCRRPATSA